MAKAKDKQPKTPRWDPGEKPDLVNDPLVVGIGASAGGIQALQEFFTNVPPDSGAAYIVILHLSPDHDSQLAHVISQVTKLPVEQVKTKTHVKPDHIYVVPPDRSLTMFDGTIVVKKLETVEERRAPVDIFFRTLAESHGPNAVGVILSGTGANGSMGIKRLKEFGGATFAQNPREAEFNEMPRNSIATELIDVILPVAEIPAKIIEYRDNRATIKLTDEPENRPEEQQNALRDIFTQLRVRTGHDFSNYKRPTILRRIERRISVRNLPNIEAYAAFLRETPEESQALLKDLLISVTNFFRDKRAFEALEKQIIPLLLKRESDRAVRIWVAGCATGEEAYSLAMLFAEHTIGDLSAAPVQIFATDIDEQAIAFAREGLYSLNDAADVSPERLRRFFTKEGERYRIRREIREMVLFAHHNLIKDPPFSHLDLISCRNLLIYLNHVAQERVFGIIHFALEPGAYLLIGSSESVDGSSDLFATVDKSNHIFQSRQVTARSLPVPESVPMYHPQPHLTNGDSKPSTPLGLERITYNDLHLKLLDAVAPPSIVINQDYDIVHVSERAGKYLQVVGGEPTNNLLRTVRSDIRMEVRGALFQATKQKANVEARGLKVDIGGKIETINLLVRPVLLESDTSRGYILVVFEPSRETADSDHEAYVAPEPVAQALEDELIRSRAHLHSALEQSEIQSEELRASNEELQAMNEELRSSAEELETSKEELQSINEELTTVNQELKVKIDELSHSNNNFDNLLRSIDIGVVFLDRSLRVNLFSPAASQIFNLIQTDVGRPLSDITSKITYPDLEHDADHVITTLQSIEREVVTSDDRVFTMRILPYRTAEDRLTGVVATFVDVTAKRRAEENVRDSEQRMRLIMDSARDYAIITLDMQRRVTSWNAGAAAIFGYRAGQIIGKSGDLLFTAEDRAKDVPEQETQTALADETAENERWHVRLDGTHFWGSGLTHPLRASDGEPVGFLKIMRDHTDRMQAEEALRESEEQFRRAIEEAPIPVIMHAEDGTVLQVSRTWTDLTGYSLGDVPTFDHWLNEAYGEGADELRDHMQRLFAGKVRSVDIEFPVRTRSGEVRHWSFSASSPGSLRDGRRFIVGMAVDITDRANAETAARASAEKLQRMVNVPLVGILTFDLEGTLLEANDAFLGMVGYSREEFEANTFTWRTFTPPEYVKESERIMENLLGKGTGGPYEKEYICKDGSRVWLMFVASNLGDGHIVEFAVDVTSRKQAEEHAKIWEQQHALIVESVSDYAIFTMDIERNVSSWNAGAQNTFGWTADEIIGRSADRVYTPEDRKERVPEKEAATAVAKGRAPDERYHIRKDGTRFYASGMMTPLRENGEIRGFVKIARDMTDHIAAEKAMRDREMLQRLVNAQEDERARLARDLHDELGQQLTVLRLKLDSLRSDPRSEAIAAELAEMDKIAGNLDVGVDQITWELRPLALEDLGLLPALEKYVNDWCHHAGVRCELIGSSLKDVRFKSDVETNLYRIVQEALNNITKHANAQNIEIMFERRGDVLVLLIEDDGKGFNPKNKKLLTKGLGLTGMRERAALIGGSLEIESAPRKGTTIYVKIPAAWALERK